MGGAEPEDQAKDRMRVYLTEKKRPQERPGEGGKGEARPSYKGLASFIC